MVGVPDSPSRLFRLSFLAAIGISLIVCSASAGNREAGFHIDIASGKLLDANQRVFIIKGVNNMVADYDGYFRNWYANDNQRPEAASPTGYFATDAIPSIRRQRFNAIRIQWRMTMAGSETRLKTVIANSIGNQMVPIIQLHDGTDSDDTLLLQSMAAYWRDFWVSLTQSERDTYSGFLIINIANEWGTWNMDLDDDGDHDSADRIEWAREYMTAITTIRAGGYEGLLIIDGHGAGQRPEAIDEQATGLLNHDPQHNIMFSIHVYEDFQNHYDLGAVLSSLRARNIPVLIGEFGPRGSTDVVDVMAQTTNAGIGYVGWAWQGDGTLGCCNSTLNIVETIDDIPGSGDNEICECFIDFRDWEGLSLTPWGDTLINHPTFGVKATSITGSVFGESPRRPAGRLP